MATPRYYQMAVFASYRGCLDDVCPQRRMTAVSPTMSLRGVVSRVPDPAVLRTERQNQRPWIQGESGQCEGLDPVSQAEICDRPRLSSVVSSCDAS
ncbi:hypothetical protein ACROYT_G016890 [Oculina patagonica]